MTATTTAVITPKVNYYYNKKLLMEALPLLVHSQFAMKETLPANAETKSMIFRRYNELPTATTALTEGVTPAGNALSDETVTMTLAQYGDFVLTTDVLGYTIDDRALNAKSGLLARQAGKTRDELDRDIFNAGTNVAYGGSATSRVTVAATEVLTTTLCDAAIAALKVANVKPISMMIPPSVKIGTTPVREGYIMIVHPYQEATIRAFSGFVSREAYPTQLGVFEGELGSYKDIRFISTTQCKVFEGAGASSIDVYSNIVFGEDAFATSEVSGESMRMIIKGLGSSGAADPIDQRATMGWKFTHASVILNQNFVRRIEVARV